MTKRKIIGICLLVVMVGAILTSIGLIMNKKADNEEGEEIYDDLIAQVITQHSNGQTRIDDEDDLIGEEEETAITSTDADDNVLTIDWESLKGTNVVAWIQWDDVINYPVMQSTNNQYYLTHAYTGAKNSNGSIFMNYTNDSNLLDANTIIYGHNMRSGKMFGTLKKYKKSSYGSHTFSIYLPDGTRHIYQMLAIEEVKDGSYAYTTMFSSEASFLEYQTSMKENSMYDTGVDVDSTRRTVTLSTCRSTGSALGWRLVVIGLESEIVKVQDAASWYEG